MVIPIPAKNKRFKIILNIEVQYPLALGIIVYDPTVKHTDYFRRRVVFRSNTTGSREIQIPLPVSPQELVLEVYNKETHDDEGFKVTQLDLIAMPPAAVWASEDRHRFMAFAVDFAQKAGHVKTGFYPAPDHEFLIQYLPVIADAMGQELVTPARIHRQMPRVQLSQKLFKQFTIPVRVAILAHEGCHFFMNTRSEKNADLCGLQYYLDYGFPTIEAVYAATKVFKMHPDSIGAPHVNRTADIMHFIDQYKKTQLAS